MRRVTFFATATYRILETLIRRVPGGAAERNRDGEERGRGAGERDGDAPEEVHSQKQDPLRQKGEINILDATCALNHRSVDYAA